MLGQMHLKGIFPGDAQIKNFAIRDDGSVIPIDFESTNIFNEDFYETDPEKFVNLSVKGLRVLFDSLNGQKSPSIDFFAGLSGEGLWEAFDKTIFSSYEDYILKTGVIEKMDEAENIERVDSLLGSLQTIRNTIKDHIVNPNN